MLIVKVHRIKVPISQNLKLYSLQLKVLGNSAIKVNWVNRKFNNSSYI